MLSVVYVKCSCFMFDSGFILYSYGR